MPRNNERSHPPTGFSRFPFQLAASKAFHARGLVKHGCLTLHLNSYKEFKSV